MGLYNKYKKKGKAIAKEFRKVTGTATARDYNTSFDNTGTADTSTGFGSEDFGLSWMEAQKKGIPSFSYQGINYNTSTGKPMNLIKKLKDRRA